MYTLVYIVTITFMSTFNLIVVELGNLETYIIYFMVFQFFSVIAYIGNLYVDLKDIIVI